MIEDRAIVVRYAWLSIAAALTTIGLKAGAYFYTGSVGLLSDALESGVNLIAALLLLITLRVSVQPPDAEHAYGHSKAEYFASGAEGTFLVVAAITIGVTGLRRLLAPVPLEHMGAGLLVSLAAAVLNGLVAVVLRRAGRRYQSVALTADATHLLADVWSSAGVLAALGLMTFTSWWWLDGAVALAVATYVMIAGGRLVRQAVDGLMDASLPPDSLSRVVAALDGYREQGITYHALRTRQSGAYSFVSVHIQVPGQWTVQRGHRLLEELEAELRLLLPGVSVLTHLEPKEDPASWEDVSLHRGQ